MSFILSDYLKSVTAIGIKSENSTLSWVATGFYIQKMIGDENKIFLVSNKHVFQNKNSISVQLYSKMTKKQMIVDVSLTLNGSALYKVHPDQNIDIAVLLLDHLPPTGEGYETNVVNIDNSAIDTDTLRSQGGTEGTLIYMVGFPMGLVNDDFLFPVCRLGCIGRNTKEQVLSKSKSFIADIQNYPGNSGSPIFSRPEVGNVGKEPAFNKSSLIGIVHSYIPYTESLLNTQTKQIVELRSENSGLAYVHPVEYIRDVVNLFIPSGNKP